MRSVTRGFCVAGLTIVLLYSSPVRAAFDGKALVTTFFDAFTASVREGVPDPRLAAVVADDYVQHEPGVEQGRAGLEAYLKKLHQGVPSLRCTVGDTISQDERIAVRTICTVWIRKAIRRRKLA